ncbi:MAG: glycosyltransferase [Paramuribaculum sp.]|nr:glycosyltransferase [Paramuribaculum sp.]
MEITVIIPVRDRARLLPRTLESIAAQTRRPDRLIIVDNGSTDDTPVKAREFMTAHPEMRIDIISEPEPGAARARNAALRLVGTEPESYVMHFDSDDIMLPQHIERVVKALENRPDTDLLYFDVTMRDSDGWTQPKTCDGDAPLVRNHIFHCVLSTTRYAASADLLRRAGWWNESLPRWNDYELGLRIALAAEHPTKLTGEPMVVILTHDDSITGTSYSADAPVLIEALDTMRRALAEAGRKQDLRYLHARRAIVAALFAREGDRDNSRALLADALRAVPTVKDALKLRLIYTTVRLLGRGGGTLGAMLLAPPKPRHATRLRKERE